MSKKQPPRRPAPPRTAAAPVTAAGPAADRRRRVRLGVVIAILIAGVWLVARLVATPTAGPGGPPTPLPVGAADACRQSPRFSSELGFTQPALATTLTNIKGLAIVDLSAADPARQPYQHETWDDAGFLGPFITDRQGNIYVAPAPLVSTLENPPELQNRVYKVDTATREMALFADLPPVQPVGGGNPYGVVGLGYDCDTESLYATSIAGSTARQELGRIVQIDLASRAATVEREGVDTLAVSVFNGASGKRLYYGLGRQPEVHSIALDAAGHAVGEPRLEVSLAGLTRGGRDTVRRIRFSDGPEMRLQLMDFSYSLQVASEREEDELRYTYDAATDGWVPIP